MKLYHMPGACSRVTLNALEEIGLEYEDQVLDLSKGDQRSPEFLAVNPRGKIPALVVDGQSITENSAILLYLINQYPDAGLLPQSDDQLFRARSVSDLIWCSATVHPVVRSIRMPIRMTDGDPAGVLAKGMELMQPIVKAIDERLAQDDWWFGDKWSIVDTYLYWNYDTAASGGFDLSGNPALLDHAKRVRARPSFQRLLKREQAAVEAKGIRLPPGASL
jgi:glutathione S-transferase